MGAAERGGKRDPSGVAAVFGEGTVFVVDDFDAASVSE